MDTLTNAEFSREYHRRIIALHIRGMDTWQARRAALYYFGNSQYELATRMAEYLVEADHPEMVDEFFKHFPMSTARLTDITDGILRDTLPQYRSAGLRTKMLSELPESIISFAR